MNSTAQPDFHPDAESLNAFVEQALAEPERLQILRHIASCNRCRQVIFLAQEAASGEESTAPAATPTFHPVRHWTSWRLAWVPAAALAAIVTLAIFLHRPQSVPNTQFARVAPPSQGTVPEPFSQKPADTGTAQSQVAVNLATRKSTSAPVHTPTKAPPSVAIYATRPATAGAAESMSTESQATAIPPGVSEERLSTQEAATQLKAENVDAARQSQLANRARMSSAPAARITQAKMKSTEGQGQASSSMPVTAPQFEVKLAPPSSFDRAVQPQKAGGLALGTPHLPSGLAALSTATAQHRTLAIDLTGTLFLSDDAGKHWEPVVRQWTGRAVDVRVKPLWSVPVAASTSGEAAVHGTNQLVVGKLAPSSPPDAAFEIVNDQGLIWASADGKTWKAN